MDKQPNKEIDDIIHQRNRLSIMATLAGVGSMNFNELKADLSLTDGNLSTHLSHLEKAGYVNITKKFKGKKPHTTVAISAKGKAALRSYIEQLEAIIQKAK